jgi:hypothetical protein
MLRNLIAFLLAGSLVEASEHHFATVTETAVLSPGSGEIEVWNTLQQSAGKFNQTIVQRLRLESGIGRSWQGSIYLDLVAGMVRDSDASLRSKGGFDGFALAFARQFTSPDSGTLGTGFMTEAGVHPEALSWKTALLADLRWGLWLLATNLSANPAWIYNNGPGSAVRPSLDSLPIDWSLGAAYRLVPDVRVGMEIFDHNEISHLHGDPAKNLGWTSSTWYVGPGLTMVAETSWLHLSALVAVGSVSSSQNAWSAKLVGGIQL